MFGRLKEWWEGLASRERRMFTLLGVTLVVCVLGYAGYQISDGLSAMESRNQAMREALRKLDENREDILAQKDTSQNVVAMITTEPPALATYLEEIEKELGVQIRNKSPKDGPKGAKFQEKQLQVTLYDVSLEQLGRFLEKVETKSPIVVTQRLFVKRSNAAKDKLDRVEITVATFERTHGKDKAKGEARAPDAGGAEGEPR